MKRLIAILTCILLALSPAMPALAEAEAETENGMENVNVTWDLEPDVPVACTLKFTGTDADFPVEYKITGWKDTVRKDGMRQISFTLNYTNKFVPTKEETETIAMANVGGTVGGTFAWALVDYETGLDIEEKNDVQLVQKVQKKTNSQKKFNGKNKTYIRFVVKAVYKITITCPKDYDGLCIGVLGQSVPVQTEADTAFWEGTVPFRETSYYSSENAQLTHFMRVRALSEE